MSFEIYNVTPELRVRVEFDPEPINPRVDYDNVGKIAYSSRSRYTLGDEPCSEDRMAEISEGIASGELVGLPVFAYTHSGTVLQAARENPFVCPWDSGQSGFVYCTADQVAQEWGGDKGQALDYLRNTVDTYSSYLAGDCFGYVVERVHRDEAGDPSHYEELDSCWGFLGDPKGCLAEGVSVAASYVEDDIPA